MNLAKYALDNTKIVYFFLAVLLIGGILSFDRLGKKEDAPFVIKSAVIMTRYPGAEPAEVERLITEPISREIQSMSGVYKIKSESMYGLSKITFELQPSLSAESIPQKWDELRRKVLNIQPQLPAGASVPTVSGDFGDVFGIYYGLVGDDGFSYEETVLPVRIEVGQELSGQGLHLQNNQGTGVVSLYESDYNYS